MDSQTSQRCRSGEEGSTLIEVVIALGIMLILMVGILQMFMVSFMQNLGSAARTQMTYKAQQVAETIRYINELYALNPGLAKGLNTGVTLPLQATSSAVTIPTGTASTDFWGPFNADVIEGPNPPYSIAYQIETSGSGFIVTVTITPTQKSPGSYIGMAISKKVIQYATYLN